MAMPWSWPHGHGNGPGPGSIAIQAINNDVGCLVVVEVNGGRVCPHPPLLVAARCASPTSHREARW